MNQSEAMEFFLPKIEVDGVNYSKFVEVEARPAIAGEVVITSTNDGKETTNTAKEGDLVVCNTQTSSQEEYILTEKIFSKRYHLIGEGVMPGFKRYKATGRCRAIQYLGENTSFVASWGEEMVLKTGDMVVTTLPQKDEIYRIAKMEFDQTYKAD